MSEPTENERRMARAFVGALGDLCALEPAARALYLEELALALDIEPALAKEVRWLMNLERE